MAKLTVLVGPPSSGKSSWARKTYPEHIYPARVYVNQDSQGKEGHMAVFMQGIADRRNIIVDRMGFSKEQRQRYIEVAKQAEYETEIIVFHQSYDTCMERCLARKDHETIKTQKDASKALTFFFSHYEKPTEDEADKLIFVYPDDRYKSNCIVIDLDGTLCNIDHRLHFVKKEGKKDWRGFFQDISKDTVNEWCKAIIEQFRDQYTIVFASGRPDDHRKETKQWLEVNGFDTEHLYMRKRGDFRSDYIAKEVILDFEILTRFKPLFFVDDRKQVVDLWRKRGFIALQCSQGDF